MWAMMRTVEERGKAVRRIMEAARRLVHGRERLVAQIAQSTGLSPANVELALTQHLETEASDEDLEKLISSAGDASAVAVILSANIFVGALRAIALARAASDHVVVRPSGRDPVFARALVDEIADATIQLEETLEVSEIEEGEIHVYGRDETIAEVRAHARAGVRVRGHGAGMGVAWISSHADVEAVANALARDVVVFDQRGCLSPRLALVEGDAARADAFADALHSALGEWATKVPRGAMSSEETASSHRYITTMTYASRVLIGDEHVVGIARAGTPLLLPPTHRHVHVAPVADAETARASNAPFARAIVIVGSDDEAAARGLAPRWARISRLGWMQRPPLDGPVDLRGS
jgi:acyl-CoA reductase-like NAD-dependent aldehyde dehydrogenase